MDAGEGSAARTVLRSTAQVRNAAGNQYRVSQRRTDESRLDANRHKIADFVANASERNTPISLAAAAGRLRRTN